jgi:hypothetical protein
MEINRAAIVIVSLSEHPKVIHHNQTPCGAWLLSMLSLESVANFCPNQRIEISQQKHCN